MGVRSLFNGLFHQEEELAEPTENSEARFEQELHEYAFGRWQETGAFPGETEDFMTQEELQALWEQQEQELNELNPTPEKSYLQMLSDNADRATADKQLHQNIKNRSLER